MAEQESQNTPQRGNGEDKVVDATGSPTQPESKLEGYEEPRSAEELKTSAQDERKSPDPAGAYKNYDKDQKTLVDENKHLSKSQAKQETGETVSNIEEEKTPAKNGGSPASHEEDRTPSTAPSKSRTQGANSSGASQEKIKANREADTVTVQTQMKGIEGHDEVKESFDEAATNKHKEASSADSSSSVLQPSYETWPQFDSSSLQTYEDNESLGVYFDKAGGWQRCSFLYFLIEVPPHLASEISIQLRQTPNVDRDRICDLVEVPTEYFGLSPNLKLYRFASKISFKQFEIVAYNPGKLFSRWRQNPKSTARAVKGLPQQFEFQPNIKLDKSTLTPVPKYLELTYYALYLLASTDARYTIPRLIGQFNAKFSPRYPGWDDGFEGSMTHSRGNSYRTGNHSYGASKGCQELIVMLSTYFSSQEADFPMFTIIIELLGLIPQTQDVLDSLSHSSLPKLLTRLHENAEEFIHTQKEHSEFFNELCRGLYLLIIADIRVNGSHWQLVVLQLVGTERGESLFTRLIKDIKDQNIPISHDTAHVLEEALNMMQKPVTVEEITYFASCISDFRHLLSYLTRFYDPAPGQLQLSEGAIKAILSHRVSNSPRTLEEAAIISEAIALCPETLKPLVTTPRLKSNISSVLRGNNCSRGTRASGASIDLRPYEQIFKTWWVPELLQNVDALSVSRYLFSNKCSLPGVLDVIELDTKQQKEAVSIWFKASFNSGKVDFAQFEQIIQDFAQLSPSVNAEVIAAKIVECILQSKNMKTQQFLELAPALDQLPDSVLTEQFVTDVTEHMKQLDQRKGIACIALVCDKYPDSIILHQLVHGLLDQAASVSYEEVAQVLYSKASKEHVWEFLIRQHYRFGAIQHVVSLLQAVLQVATHVSQGELSGREFIKIAFQSNEAQAALVWYCMEALRIHGHSAADTLNSDLRNWLDRLQDCRESFELLNLFMENVGSKAQNSEGLQEQLDSAQDSFYNKPLNQFELDPCLQEYLQTAKAIEPVLHSSCFLEYYLRPEQFEVEYLLYECPEAFDRMKSELRSLINNIDNTPVNTVEVIFGTVPKIETEFRLLEQVLDVSSYRTKFLSFVDTLNFLTAYEELGQYAESLRRLVELFRIHDPPFLSLELTFRELVLQRNPQLTSKEFTRHCKNLHHKFKTRPPERYESVMKIIVAVADTDLINFLLAVEEHEVDHMKESVNDHEEELHVHTQTVFDLEKLWGLIQQLKQCKSSAGIVRGCTEYCTHKNLNTILAEITNCYSNLHALKDLHRELNLREEAKKKQVLEIAVYSTVRVLLKGEIYDVSLSSGESHGNCIDLESLLELKDRVSLILHTNEARDQEDTKKLQCFISFVETLQSITTKLTTLFTEGYPLVLARPEPYSCTGGVFLELAQFEEELCSRFDQWKCDLSYAYSTHPILTFLFGRQFWVLEEFFLTGTNADQAAPLIHYLGKNPLPVEYFEEKESITERFDELAQALNSLPKTVETPNAKLDASSRQVHFIESEDITKSLFSLSLLYSEELPRSNQILFCHYQTSLSQIEAFLYRSFSYPERLHIVVNCENLSIEAQHFFRIQFHKLLTDLFNYESANLAFICRSPHSTVLSYFKHHDNIEFRKVKEDCMLDDKLVKEQLERVCESIEVVTSAVSGLGKSTHVKKCAEKCKRQYVEFPVAGEVDLDRVNQRLMQLGDLTNHLLHIQLGQVDDCLLLDEFLVSLCLLRTFYWKQEPFLLPESAQVCVEVANTYEESLLQSLTYLKYVRQTHIKTFDLRSLVVNLDMKDPLQVVCTYLKMLKDGSISSTQPKRIWSPLERTQILPLMKKYFVEAQQRSGQSPTYTQLTIFVSVLHRMLLNFEACYFFSLENVGEYIRDISRFGFGSLVEQIKGLRRSIIGCLLLSVEEFTTKSFKHIHEEQSRTQAFLNEKIDRSEALAKTFKCNLTWESSNHFNLIITEEGSTMPIYRHQNNIEENIRKLLYIQANAFCVDANQLSANVSTSNYALEDYSTMDHMQLLGKLKLYSKDPNFEQKHRNSSYVLTPDNFLKMNLIYLRAQSGIPIVIMGETGCGKTSLIRFFVEAVLREKLVTFPIHAGVTTADIITRMNELRGLAKSVKKLWVFFDEFNTTASLATICEILCSRTLEGHRLPENLICIGACNPYRLKTEHDSYDEDVGIKKNSKVYNTQSRRLVHMVHPLPSSIIDYVWDFGSLTQADLKRYVAMMLAGIDPVFVELICFSHAYFETEEGVSSVSLRDVARFKILFEWFKNSIVRKERHSPLEATLRNKQKFNLQPKKKHPVPTPIAAGILALTHCYYLRINSLAAREQYLEEVAQASNGQFSQSDILTVMEIEQDDYLQRMEIPEGTALNRALRENIFAIIPCIFNEVPVFICGKPGCSKSLAIQLIFANLRGKKSRDNYFKSLPELIMVSFQGSDSCTSEGILKAFNKAHKFLEIRREACGGSVLPVVIFDEIGLAEISRNNPLKVLHSLLELENREIAFVGISNWRLDSSKMNRAVYLARPDPPQNELIETAMSIYKSAGNVSHYEKIIKNLAKAYHALKQELKQTEHADFFGLRDFYQLIKQVSQVLLSEQLTEKHQIVQACKHLIQRNFGGYSPGTKLMGMFFMQEHKVEDIYPMVADIPLLDLIEENLKGRNSRYLMLMGREDVTSFLLNECRQKRQTRVIVGSNLDGDTARDDYGFRSLSDIILYMERGVSIILQDMSHIYSSLYDLFNQNFVVSGNRRYCRIALGAHFNPRCFVHDDFHAIVFLNNDEKTIRSTDAPFLNRFEKHIVSLDTLLNARRKAAVNEIAGWVLSFFTPVTL